MDDLNALVAPYLGDRRRRARDRLRRPPLAVVVLARRTSKLDRRLAAITRGADGRSLESILDAHLDKVYASPATSTSSGRARRSSRRPSGGRSSGSGLVRFNPFEDTGGNQSFALALLDAHGDGFVISSLHARHGHARLRQGGHRRAGGGRRCRPRRRRRSGWRSASGAGAGEGADRMRRRDRRAGTGRAAWWRRGPRPRVLAPADRRRRSTSRRRMSRRGRARRAVAAGPDPRLGHDAPVDGRRTPARRRRRGAARRAEPGAASGGDARATGRCSSSPAPGPARPRSSRAGSRG